MTMYMHGRRAAQVRRRRFAAAGILVLAVLAGLAGRYLWGQYAASAQGAEAGPGGVVETAEPRRQPDEQPNSRSDDQQVATGLDPELARRFAAAQKAAAADGVELTLTSGWRSAADQQVLVDQALSRYGSEREAHRWVLPPETSEHVKGLAIDVGGTPGALWLGEHALDLGLCRTYTNEVWHFELLADGASECPEMHPDASWGW